MENQNNNDRLHFKGYIDYGRMQKLEKARLAAHLAVEKKINRRISLIFIASIAFSVLVAIGMILLLATGFYYVWGVIEWSVRGALLPS